MSEIAEWDQHQHFEADWWGDCTNTFGEETKQISYALRMGLVNTPHDGHWPVYDLRGTSVLDIGGGPVSMLLKTINRGESTVVDPCAYPPWIEQRYRAAGIGYLRMPGELLDEDVEAPASYDEVWIYNVLQHVQDPKRIIAHARERTRLIRLFEWIDLPPHPGHPHELRAQELGEWLGGYGTVEQMNENGCIGRAFYGVFPSAS